MPNPRQPYLYPKTSTFDLTKDQPGRPRFNPEVPSPLSQAVSRRMVEQQVADAKAKDMRLSPLDRAVAGLEAAAMAGSMMFEAIQQAPKMLQGEDAYAEAIGNRMYAPRYQPEKAREYVGNALDAIDRLQTEYKLPPIMPELAGLQPLAEAAKQQAAQGIKRGALQAGMGLERSLAQPVTDIMNRGGLGAEMLGSFNTQPAQVVKEKGGNWLKGHVENATAPLRQMHQENTYMYDPEARLAELSKYTPEFIADRERIFPRFGQAARDEIERIKPKAAINDWIKKKLNKYIKNEMGTPEDPVRALAEQGITHLPSDTGLPPNYSSVQAVRKEAGFPEEGLAQSDLAKAWEGWADKPINFATTGEAMNVGKGEPWMEKVDPFTRVHGIAPNWGRHIHSDLGFDHIIDVLKEDLASGRITPEDLDKMNMAQAVRRTHEYNEELAKKMAETKSLAREGLPVYKEYPEGYRWIELNRPGSFASESDAMGHSVRGYEPPYGHEDWVEASGELGHDTYGHGGWEAIKSGKAKVYSLVDPKGDPHVTIEVAQHDNPYGVSGEEFARLPGETKAQYREYVRQWRERNPEVQELTDDDVVQALKEAGVKPINPPRITQIKGKQNAAPKEDYLPYVQDFQRTTKYPIEGDFANSGFIKQDGKYMTQEEYDDYLLNELKPPPEPPVEGMKRGGKVHVSDDPATMQRELQDQHFAGGGLLRKAMKIAMHEPEAVMPSARGAMKFAEPKPKTMGVIKEKGGNWLTGIMAGNADSRLNAMKPYSDQSNRINLQKAKIASMENAGSYLPESIQNAKAELAEIESQQAINKWVESNVGNYIKKEMATPTDPVRLMLEKRSQEIEAQFQTDMNRAKRLRDRAEAETDPRRQANMMRQAAQQEEQAQVDRDFAMEHVSHLPKDEHGVDEDALYDLGQRRAEQGFPEKGMAKSEPAQRWENLADEAIYIRNAEQLQKQKGAHGAFKAVEQAYLNKADEIQKEYAKVLRTTVANSGNQLTEKELQNIINNTPINDKARFLGVDIDFKQLQNDYFEKKNQASSGLLTMAEENPWVEKLAPTEKLYSGQIGGLELDHVIDVIKQDVAEGRIRPEQLSKLSMDQAIKRTAEFNAEQAKKMRETAIKNMEGFPVHKEYPEGYKWIELTTPQKELPSGWSVKEALNPMSGKQFQVFDENGSPIVGAYGKTEESAISSATKQLGRPELEEALKYEGDTMGHCVGGYCPDVLEGRSRIFSLRDARGEPHVTVEVQPQPPSRTQIENAGTQRELGVIANRLLAENSNLNYADADRLAYEQLFGKQPDRIVQIKGKQNAAPKEQYLPYVQDFVRSGQWSDVGDLKNTGLYNVQGKYFTDPELTEAATKYGRMGVMDTPWEVARQRHVEAGIPEETALQNWVDAFREGRGRLELPPEEGMKAGGLVNISDNPDSMMMELEDQKFAVGGAAIKRVLKIADHAERAIKAQELLVQMATSGQVNPEAQRALLKAQSGARSLPTVLPRAKPKTKDEIRAFAQQTADQLNAAQQGKFLRADPTGKSENVAGKSKKQWEMEQGLTHDIRSLGLPLDPIKTANIEDQLNMLKMGITGDTTVSDQVLHRAGQYALQSPSEQQGGSMFGLRQRIDPAAWASNEKILEGVQRDVNEFSQAYGDVPVIGQYISMGPKGTNFAQHFADANLEAIASHGLTSDQAEQVNNLIKAGNAKSGAHPDFPGVQDPAAAYFYFSFYPELRKHFNDIMTKPDVTSKLGLPDGRVILHAITDPELRDMPVLTSGRAQYQLVPGQDPKNLPLSEHSTYTHNLPRKPDAPVTQTPFPVPAELEFSDVTEYAKPRYEPSEMTRVMQTAAPRQIVDPQHIDEIKQYEDFMRQYSPQSEKKKTGGLIKIKRKDAAPKKEVKRADGGAVYNTNPDMSDGGQILQGDAFKRGGDVRMTKNADSMLMELQDKMLKRK